MPPSDTAERASAAAWGNAITPILADDALLALLEACGLPTADLGAAHCTTFFGCRRDGRLIGAVGLEPLGGAALLRSLAVADTGRGAGLGVALVARAEQEAVVSGARQVFLLTTTAAPFFARLGYRPADRGAAPAEVAATTQFAGLCPASATLMVRPALDSDGHTDQDHRR
jgi:arsenate reductase